MTVAAAGACGHEDVLIDKFYKIKFSKIRVIGHTRSSTILLCFNQAYLPSP